MPPLFYLIPLVVILAGTVAMLWAISPPVTDRTVMAFVPWMMFGATLHVFYKFDQMHGTEVVPSVVEPLFQAPAVYLTTAIVVGNVWIISTFLYAGGLRPTIYRPMGILGTGFFIVFATLLVFLGWEQGAFNPFWPVIALVVAGIVTAIAWLALSLWFTEVVAVTGLTGSLVVFSHLLDGVSTAVGVDMLGAHEEVPASRLILEVGEMLPTADVIGVGWLFVLVKIALAVAVVYLFTEFVRERPDTGRLLLALIAAVGLGPGVHNLLLFTVTPVG